MRRTWTVLDKNVRSVATKADPRILHAFATALNSIWRSGGSRPRLGLAISGGVDSMALASLCRELTGPESRLVAPDDELRAFPRTHTSFTAFVVDHKLRKNSDVEAQQVAAELERLGIEPHVLDLDWQSYGDPSRLTNIESAARKLRYQILGRACSERGINSLLLAHHADDQAETVMTRLLSNFVGTGLGGMNFITPIPECTGIYGVDQSGALQTGARQQARRFHDRVQYERGGVNIARPLLTFSKEQLVSTCKQTGVRWFEDHTNADPKFTLRNTVRYLNTSEVLPVALRKESLSTVASKIFNERGNVEENVQESMSDMPVTLDIRSGQADFVLQSRLTTLSPANYRFYATLLRKMLELVTPKDTIALQHLDQAVEFVFQDHWYKDLEANHATKKQIQIAGVCIRPKREVKDTSLRRPKSGFTFHRSVPTKKESTEQTVVLWPPAPSRKNNKECPWSDWCLWDGRYWIRIRPPKSLNMDLVEVIVRFLNVDNLTALRRCISKKAFWQLDNALSHVKGVVRFTIPAICMRRKGEPVEEIVVLPSLKWSGEGWKRDIGKQHEDIWLWDIRFKHVELNLKAPQSVVS